jgi:hypothetical protein
VNIPDGFNMRKVSAARAKGKKILATWMAEDQLNRLKAEDILKGLKQEILQTALAGKTELIVFYLEDASDWKKPLSGFEGSYEPNRLSGVGLAIFKLLEEYGYRQANGYQVLIVDDMKRNMGWDPTPCIKLNWS